MRKTLMMVAALVAAVACVEVANAIPVLRVSAPTVEYGCAPSAPNNRCIVTLRDSTANTVIVSSDTVPVGVMRTVTIERQLVAGEKVVITGTFVGLTATGKTAPPVAGRGEGVFDPNAAPAVPIITVTVTP